MNKLLNILSERASALLLAIVFAVAALFPLTAWAERPGERNDPRGNKPGGSTGDPLDTNDSGGDDGDGDIQSNHGVGSASDDSWFRILGSPRIVFLPQYDGTILNFKVFILSDAAHVVEDSDAK